jgi:SNW domain-containing protein 1
MADWKVPPCISNWKNAKGYTIPLDKRLAADGRGLMEVTINDGFAKLSESLYVAEARAREAVETRAKIQRELLSKEKDRKEEELRSLAQQARMARVAQPPPLPHPSGPLPPPPPLPAGMARPSALDYDGEAAHGSMPPPPPGYMGAGAPAWDVGEDEPRRPEPVAENESAEARRERLRREEIREERRRERERERRLEARDAHGAKRSKLTRDRERDVSERVALGQASVGAGRAGEALYDQRLFNQDAGLDSGFGADDAYNTFSKPLFADRGNSLYAPSRGGADLETLGEGGAAAEEAVRTDRFRPDRGFAGAELESVKGAAGGRTAGPVVFERPPEAQDPFGLGDIMGAVGRKG